MKKIGSILLMLLALYAAIFPIAAFAETSDLPAVVDQTWELSSDELEDIDNRLRELRSLYDMDVVFLISNSMTPGRAQASADDYFDYNGYGPDGIIYYVSPENREYAFSTTGDGIGIFNNDSLTYINEKMLPDIKAGRWYEAAAAYAEGCGAVLKSEKVFKKNINLICGAAGIIFIPLIVAFILMRSKLSAMKTVIEQKTASNYIVGNSLHISHERDIFLRSMISKVPKPKQKTGNVHTSSSGRSHGGMSGSF